MGLFCYYLDAPEERGSKAILKELHISISQSLNSFTNSFSLETLSRNHSFTQERKSKYEVNYHIESGEVYLDVRDSGDCWLRICLNAGQTAHIPSNLYHKFTHESFNNIQIYPEFIHHSSNTPLTIENSFIYRYHEQIDSLKLVERHKYRELICELCSQFYDAGWVTGTGGSISIRYGNRIFMTPSGVQKERILPDELYMLDIEGNHLSVPPQKIPGKLPKLSDCSPLFLHAYRLRKAGAVLHSHDTTCVLVTAITSSNEFKISHQEMIKGIVGYGYHDELIIPIIENTAWESELADSLEQAIISYPKTVAVLVRDHGIYVWGDSWEQAKRHGECLHYLFNVAIQKYNLHISPIYSHLATQTTTSTSTSINDEMEHKRKRISDDENNHMIISSFSSSSSNGYIYKSCDVCNRLHSNNSHSHGYAHNYQYIVLDIEGTTTPITFVKDILFPYARNHVMSHLRNTWNHLTTQHDIKMLCLQILQDYDQFQNNLLSSNLLPFPPWIIEMIPFIESMSSSSSSSSSFTSDSVHEDLLTFLTKYVHWCIEMDRKIAALKDLQGRIWRNGYETNHLHSIVYDDVPIFLSNMKRLNKQVCIYSSGSREAQKLLFKHSNHGDLRSLLSCYFDTSIGHKRQKESYQQIFLSLGANQPEEILFVTDIIEEAYAAKEAGVQVVLSNRSGNAPLPSNHPFPVINSFNLL